MGGGCIRAQWQLVDTVGLHGVAGEGICMPRLLVVEGRAALQSSEPASNWTVQMPPDLRAGAAGRCFPLQSVSFHSSLTDLRDASVEAALPLQPQQDSEGQIPFLFSLPLKIFQAFAQGPQAGG